MQKISFEKCTVKKNCFLHNQSLKTDYTQEIFNEY